MSGHTVLMLRSELSEVACVVSASPLCLDLMTTTQMHWQRHSMCIIYRENIHMQRCLFPALVCDQSSTTTRLIRRMFMKISYARFYVPIGYSYHLQLLRFLRERKRDSVMALSVSLRQKFPQVFQPELEITRKNMKHMTRQKLMLFRHIQLVSKGAL